MEPLVIHLSSYGSHLGSRLLGRDIFAHFFDKINGAEFIVIDFMDVHQISLSFGTELFDSIYTLHKPFKTVNENDFTKSITDFCKDQIRLKGTA